MKQFLLLALFALFVNISYAETPDSTSFKSIVDANYTIQQNQRTHYQMTEGEKLYMGGVALSMIGGGLTMLSMDKHSDIGVGFGAVVIASGAIVAIHGQREMIIEERNKKRDAISISPSSSGIGLAIKF